MISFLQKCTLLCLLSLGGNSQIRACNPEFLSLQQQVNTASHIFEGHIIAIKDSNLSFCLLQNGERIEVVDTWKFYHFRIRHTFKGKPKGYISLRGGEGNGDCSLGGRVGDEWIIFADSYIIDNPQFYAKKEYVPHVIDASGCTGSRWIEDFRLDEIAYLNDTFGTAYAHPASLIQITRFGLGTFIFIGVMGIFLLFSGGLPHLRKERTFSY